MGPPAPTTLGPYRPAQQPAAPGQFMPARPPPPAPYAGMPPTGYGVPQMMQQATYAPGGAPVPKKKKKKGASQQGLRAFVSGAGLVETYFTCLPDSVVRDELTPSQSPVARVVFTGDVVPADVIAKQVARRCPDCSKWKWEAVAHGEKEFLISLPSFEDLDRVDGIQVAVPSFATSMHISAWRSSEVAHKFELHKVWLHVDGVPHTLRHFLGLWAVGSLLGKTVDVDLLSLRRRGVVRIQVAMIEARILDKTKDALGGFTKTDVVVKLKAFEFHFTKEPADYVPESDFIPLVWEKKPDGDGDGGAPGNDDDDAMDTSDSRAGPSVSTSTQTPVGAAGGVAGGRTGRLGEGSLRWVAPRVHAGGCTSGGHGSVFYKVVIARGTDFLVAYCAAAGFGAGPRLRSPPKQQRAGWRVSHGVAPGLPPARWPRCAALHGRAGCFFIARDGAWGWCGCHASGPGRPAVRPTGLPGDHARGGYSLSTDGWSGY
ncbi:hypothetical protein ACQ4PT_008574 [Festuca glaucescens]